MAWVLTFCGISNHYNEKKIFLVYLYLWTLEKHLIAVTGDPISTWLQFLWLCIVCGSMYCVLYVRMCVCCVYGSMVLVGL